MKFGDQLENQNPDVYNKSSERPVTAEEEDDNVIDQFDAREIFDLIRDINDPEHPLTLEQLHVVQEDLIEVNNEKNTVKINFTPTIPHCSMATLIGLSIRVKLLRSLPARFKVNVEVTKGTHNAENAVNKQLADKERVAAALENTHLIKVINQCVAPRRQVCLLTVAVLWGGTNPLIKKNSRDLTKINSNGVTNQLFLELKYLMTNVNYLIPLALNQAGSVVYFVTLQSADLSLSVPVANSLTFVFTAVSGWILGEQLPKKNTVLGVILILVGTTLCCYDKYLTSNVVD